MELVNASYEERQATGGGALQQIHGGETPDHALLRSDAMILGLRLIEGVSTHEFEARFGMSPTASFGPAIERHLGTGLLEWAGDRLRLTPRGLLLANEVFVDLLPEDAAAASTTR